MKVLFVFTQLVRRLLLFLLSGVFRECLLYILVTEAVGSPHTSNTKTPTEISVGVQYILAVC